MIAIEQQLMNKVKQKRTIQYETIKLVTVVVVIIIIIIIIIVVVVDLSIIRQGDCRLNAVKNRIKVQLLKVKIRNKGHQGLFIYLFIYCRLSLKNHKKSLFSLNTTGIDTCRQVSIEWSRDQSSGTIHGTITPY